MANRIPGSQPSFLGITLVSPAHDGVWVPIILLKQTTTSRKHGEHKSGEMVYNKICVCYTCQKRFQFHLWSCEFQQNIIYIIIGSLLACITSCWQAGSITLYSLLYIWTLAFIQNSWKWDFYDLVTWHQSFTVKWPLSLAQVNYSNWCHSVNNNTFFGYWL